MSTSTLTLQDAELSIQNIEKDISTNSTIIHHMFTKKKDAVRFLADCYEVLIFHKKIDLQVTQIAHYLVKKLTKLNKDIYPTYIYDSLPSKFKSHRESLEYSEIPSDNSSLNTTNNFDYEEENQSEISFVEDQISILKLRLTKLKTSQYVSLLEPEIYREQYIIRRAALKFLSDALDDRKTVPINTIHLLLLAYDTYNLKHAAGEYISLLKKFGAQKKDEGITNLKKIFSTKQMGKILRGQTRELHQSMEIITQEDAYANGFYGRTSCDECSSWRIILESSYDFVTQTFTNQKLNCFACGVITAAPSVKLPLTSPTPQFTESREL